MSTLKEGYPVPNSASSYPSLDEEIRSPSFHPLDQPSAERSPITMPDSGGISAAYATPGSAEDRSRGVGLHRQLPSLSDMLDHPESRALGTPSSEASGFPFPRSHISGSPDPPPPLIGGETRPQTLKKEQSSSSGSTSSGSSFGYPRTPIDGTLPIHALLSPKEGRPYESVSSYYEIPRPPPDQERPLTNKREAGAPTPLSNGMSNQPLTS